MRSASAQEGELCELLMEPASVGLEIAREIKLSVKGRHTDAGGECAGEVRDLTVPVDFQEVFAFFQDADRFPGGATFLLNTQYSPYDGCQGGPASGGAFEQHLQRINERIFLDVARERSDTIAVDHHPDWLGHGGFANDARCFCRADNTPWVFVDGIHPNDLGYAAMAAKWQEALAAALDCE